MIALLITLLASTCTFHQGQQIEVDMMGARYRFYIYEKPSYLVTSALRGHCKRTAGAERERWGRCSLTFLRNEVRVPAVTRIDWNHFTAGGKWRDYTDAVNKVVAGRVSSDGPGQTFVDRCLIGSHAAFGAYDWGHRVTGDSHCKRGKYPR